MHATLERLTGAVFDPQPRPGSANLQEITRLVVARPWRRTAVDAATLSDLQRKIGEAIQEERPIEFSLPFGGYKGWRTPCAPNLDWAEVFWLDYFRHYAERIVALHAPGVIVSLTCMRGVLEWINRLPQADQDAYLSQLSQLLRARSSPRLRFDLVDHTVDYGGIDAVLRLLEGRLPDMAAPGPAELQSARRNVLPLSPLQASRAVHPDGSPTEDEVDLAARRCAAMMSLERRREFNKFGRRIQISHVRGGSLSLHLGSCRTSAAQPWVARGLFEWRPDSQAWLERLVSHDHAAPEVAALTVAHPLQTISPALQSLAVLIPEGGSGACGP